MPAERGAHIKTDVLEAIGIEQILAVASHPKVDMRLGHQITELLTGPEIVDPYEFRLAAFAKLVDADCPAIPYERARAGIIATLNPPLAAYVMIADMPDVVSLQRGSMVHAQIREEAEVVEI